MAKTLNALYKKWVGSGPVDVAYLKSVINRDIRAAVAGKIRATPAAVTDWRGDLIAVGKLAKATHTNPRLTPAAIARAHRNPDIHIDIGSHNATRAKGARTNPKRRAPSLPNRGYYILQLDPDIGKHGGLAYGLDHVTPVSWRIWRTSRVLPGYTFKLPESLYNKPAFIEWARKNSGPGFPLYASYAQAKAMVKALM